MVSTAGIDTWVARFSNASSAARASSLVLIAVTDASHAEEIALQALVDDDADHENPRILEEPYRTSASWIVPVESESGTGNVHVDAVTKVSRIGTVENE
ncbi:hypothetical protein OB955_14430 [Halobacteria archaeon AArc-m2/3/4]|uniref:Uncharacterized protein n=1 Tax=Natronoglomus mannanivorans TaxID=2979990 RepID=A0ABT2QG78_9EURY|nr:hypothetical protein [Halobacteria archaeon AArc-m2/3/4]